MMFAEVFVPAGTLTSDQLDRLVHGLTMHGLHESPEALDEAGVERGDPGVMEFLETITNVVVHEVGIWVAGGARIAPGDPPRYVVRLYVPGSWRKGMSEHLIRRVTRTIAGIEPDPERVHREPCVEVHVLGVPEGGYGVFGRPVGDTAMTELISGAIRGTEDVPDGMTVDPTCGAIIPLDGPVTAEVDGRTYGFCCPGCRRHFLSEHERVTGGTAR